MEIRPNDILKWVIIIGLVMILFYGIYLAFGVAAIFVIIQILSGLLNG